MFSHDDRLKAVELLIEYDMSYADTIRELGYPTRQALRNWYCEYRDNGELRQGSIKKPKYSLEERQKAVDYYIEHGKSISRTVKNIGYPSRQVLGEWIIELAPDQKKHCRAGGTVVKYPRELKEQAVISLCSRSKPAKDVAAEYGTTREILYIWKRQLIDEGCVTMITNDSDPIKTNNDQKIDSEISDLDVTRKELEQQVVDLQNEVRRLKLERDIYEKAAEILKKDEGISLKYLTNREKAIIINALRDKYQLKDLLKILNMAKSSYCYQAKSIETDKYATVRLKIEEIYIESAMTYEYRRIHSDLKLENIVVSEKVVRRIMMEANLVVKKVNGKKYNSYQGEISPEVDNLVQRDFHADAPNIKWLTDITEFRIPAGKVYLSPIIDCFDGLPVSWTVGTSPNAELVNSMLDEAVNTLKLGEKPIVHSYRGCHYRWPGWIERIDQAGLTRSMSKKGCSPDNAACEGFFGRLKVEMFYGYSWKDVTIEQFIERLNNYIKWYAEKRIKMSLGDMSPLNYRRSLGLVA